MPLEGLQLMAILLLIEVKLNYIFISPSFICPDVLKSSETFVHDFKELGGIFVVFFHQPFSNTKKI